MTSNSCDYAAGKLGSRSTPGWDLILQNNNDNIQWHIHTCMSNLCEQSCQCLLHFHCTFWMFSSDVSSLFFRNSSLIFNLAALWGKYNRCFSYPLWQGLVNKHQNQQRKSHRHSSFRNQTSKVHNLPVSAASSSLNTAILVLCSALNARRTCIYTHVQLLATSAPCSCYFNWNNYEYYHFLSF